jgi:hypothetical protein
MPNETTDKPKPEKTPAQKAAHALHAKLSWPPATAREFISRLSDDQVKQLLAAASQASGADGALRAWIDRRQDAIAAAAKAEAAQLEKKPAPAAP